MKKPAKPERKQVSSKKQKPARPGPQDNPPEEGRSGSLEADFPIVDIGASAGGLEAMELFLGKVPEGIQSLAQFASENPNTVLRVARDGTLLYTNEAGLSQLSEWHLQAGQAVPPMLREVVLQSLDSGSTQLLDTEHRGRVYSFFVAPVVDADCANLYGRDVTEQKRAEEELRRSQREQSIRNDIAGVFLTVPDENMYGAVLQIILKATESSYGIFGYLDEDGALVAPSMTRDIWKKCQIPGKSIRFPRETWGESIWARAILQKKSLWKNEPGRVPEGHVPIDNVLVVPILYRDEVIGNFQVANKAGGYTEADKVWLEGVAQFIAPVLNARLERDRREAERKRVEKRLRETNEYLENLLNHANAPIIVWNPQFRIARFNHAFECLTGRRADEVIGESLEILFPPTLVESSMKRIKETLSGHRWEAVEISILHLDGSVRIVLWNSATILAPDGNTPVATIAQGQDVTERKRAEEAQRESEERYRIVFEGGAQGILVADAHTKRFVHANPSICRMLGYSEKELLQLGVADIHPKDSLAHVVSEFESQVRGETTLSPSLPCLRKDGTVLYADVNASGAIINGQECSVGFFADVTDRKLAEEALHKERRRFNDILEKLPVMICLLTPDYQVPFANRRFREHFGESHGRRCFEYMFHRTEPCPECQSFTPLKTHAPHHWEWATPKGIYVDIYDFPFTDVDGSPLILEMDIDITDRKRAEDATRNAYEQLAEQRRREKEHVEAELKKVRDELVRTTRLAAIGQISAGIAHDLRNPLGAANNAIYYLRHGGTKDASKTAEYLEIIDQEIGIANRIIGKLMDMAQDREPAKQAVDLGRAVEEVFKLAPGAEQMRCRMALCPDPFLVEADPDQLRRVIANLLSNAIHATECRGDFFVEATRGPEGDTILFRDTGPGIPPGIRQSVFEPLVTNRTHGTGLGLTICREIVRHHGGAIEIIDHEEGGAAFQIWLPRQ